MASCHSAALREGATSGASARTEQAAILPPSLLRSAIQKLPVRFILDRAGLVGNDGPTHHGSFDLAYLGCIPGIAICAPSDELELKNMVQTIYTLDSIPSALRFPRGSALGIEKINDLFGMDLDEMPQMGETLPVGKGRVVREAPEGATKRVAILGRVSDLNDESVEWVREQYAEDNRLYRRYCQ